MPDYTVEQELVQFGEGSLTFLEPRFRPTPGRPTTRPESHGAVSEYSPYRNPSGRLFNSQSVKHLINRHSEVTNLQG